MGFFPATTVLGFILLLLLVVLNGFSASSTAFSPAEDVEPRSRELYACQRHPLNIVVATTRISCTPGGFRYENEEATHKGRPSSRKLGHFHPRSPPAPASNKNKSYFIKAPPPLIA